MDKPLPRQIWNSTALLSETAATADCSMTAGNKMGHGADTSRSVQRTHGYRRVRSTRLLLGGYAITMQGVADFDLRDTYHLIIAISWPRFLLVVVCAHLAINIGFALLFMARPDSIANMPPGSFADAFFFSVETSATVGYGDMHPVTFYGHAVCTAEIFVGIAFTALATGLLFVRFSRPKARIRFAENAVVASHAGQPTLMIRLANGRRGLLYDATAHLALLLSTSGASTANWSAGCTSCDWRDRGCRFLP